MDAYVSNSSNMRASSAVSDSATLWTVVCQTPSDHGISQARIRERAAILSTRGSSWPREWTRVSCVFCIGRWSPLSHHSSNRPWQTHTHTEWHKTQAPWGGPRVRGGNTFLQPAAWSGVTRPIASCCPVQETCQVLEEEAKEHRGRRPEVVASRGPACSPCPRSRGGGAP